MDIKPSAQQHVKPPNLCTDLEVYMSVSVSVSESLAFAVREAANSSAWLINEKTGRLYILNCRKSFSETRCSDIGQLQLNSELLSSALSNGLNTRPHLLRLRHRHDKYERGEGGGGRNEDELEKK